MKKLSFAALRFALLLAMAVLVTAEAAVPALAQNPVPATAREAAAMPAFAAKLHASRPAPARRRPRPARSCSGRSLPQDGIFYENGPVNRTVDAWTINFGFAVSDSITLGGSVNSFDIWVWEFPGDVMTSVDWSITSAPFGGTVYGSGTVSGARPPRGLFPW